MPSTTFPIGTRRAPRSSACSSPVAGPIIWDAVSPHGAPGSKAPAPHHDPAPAPGPHGGGTLDVVRMLLRFGRIPAERYELRKPDAPEVPTA